MLEQWHDVLARGAQSIARVGHREGAVRKALAQKILSRRQGLHRVDVIADRDEGAVGGEVVEKSRRTFPAA